MKHFYYNDTRIFFFKERYLLLKETRAKKKKKKKRIKAPMDAPLEAKVRENDGALPPRKSSRNNVKMIGQ